MNDLMITLGRDEHGENIVVDLAILPHLLIGARQAEILDDRVWRRSA